eukprot:gene5907-7356_t
MSCKKDVSQEAVNSRKIDKMIKKDAETMGSLKLLLLGSGDCGKSTIFKQIVALQNDSRRKELTPNMDSQIKTIYSNIVTSMKCLLNALPLYHLSLLDDEDIKRAEKVNTVYFELDNITQATWMSVVEDISLLWKNDTIQSVYNNPNRLFQLMDSTEYFMENIDRFKGNFKPNQNDLLRARVRTTGIVEADLVLNEIDFQVLEEDQSVSRYVDSLELFREMVNSIWFTKSAFVLFFNKVDLFKKKIKKVPMSQYLTEFTGRNDSYEDTSSFLKQQFLQTNKTSKPIYSHFTCALDTEAIQAVFRSIQDMLVTSLVEEFTGTTSSSSSSSSSGNTTTNIARLVNGYRVHGHLSANIDPLAITERLRSPLLNPEIYGLDPKDSAPTINTKGLVNTPSEKASVSQIVEYLERVYCGDITAQFDHIESPQEKEWLYEHFEQIQNESLAPQKRVEILKNLVKSEVFDHFMHKKFPTFKRYGLEGNESMMIACDSVFRESAESGIENVVIGMPHRGRLNLLVQMCGYPAKDLFWKVKGNSEFEEGIMGIGDVVSHIGVSSDLKFDGDKKVHVSLIQNPSHLEAVDPVALGKTRAKQFYEGSESMCLMLHGDAAVTGQGVVTETLSLSQLPGFKAGGAVHIVVNNQLGFTTIPSNGRSTRYSGDIGKFVGCPVIIVNSQSPELVEKVSRLAVQYRQKFKKDIFIDLIGWRKYGHNEVDEPSFTQPTMYNKNIRQRSSIPQLYAAQLVADGLISEQEISDFRTKENSLLEEQLQMTSPDRFQYSPMDHLQGKWSDMVQSKHLEDNSQLDTGYDVSELKQIANDSTVVPEGFSVHQRLIRSFSNARTEKTKQNLADWATAEAVAVGSLMKQGYNVRISGQDVGRGTFSQRHWNLHEQNTESIHQPLNHMGAPGRLEVVNSNLSEFAVMAYEYGYSLESPQTLPIWEAQFGDFANGAQIVIDQFIASGESKWLRQTGIVILLPHGFDGAGPEHSSCRIERFLQLSDTEAVQVTDSELTDRETNIYIINPSTPANYFHALRRQLIRQYRKPLIVASPKVLLRHPNCYSSFDEMGPSTHFQPVLADPDVTDPASIEKVVFCSGKIFYDLQEMRKSKPDANNVAFVRLEQITPFPYNEIEQQLNQYPNATKFVWAQEEQQNAGSWSFVEPRFKRWSQTSNIKYIGRGPLSASATGISAVHKAEASKLLNDVFNY